MWGVWFPRWCITEAWKQLMHQGVIGRQDQLSFSVPTGNFGDVLAGYYAYRLGLPVKKFVVASNANNVLTEFIRTGVYDRNRPFIKTISPSMDILISSNLERLLYYMTEGDTAQVKTWMDQLAAEGRYQVTPEVLEKSSRCLWQSMPAMTKPEPKFPGYIKRMRMCWIPTAPSAIWQGADRRAKNPWWCWPRLLPTNSHRM